MARSSHAARPAPEAKRRQESAARWRAFLAFQLLFWGGFFLIRVTAAALERPEVLWPYMGPRVTAVLAYLTVTTGVHVIVSRLPQRRPLLRLAAALGLCLIGMAPIHLLESTFARAFTTNFHGGGFFEFFVQFGWIFVMWAGYYYAQDLIFLYRKQTEDLTRAQAEAHGAEIRMLRYQLNPHFLFNALNAVSTLVLEKRNDLAEATLLRLSRFLRHTLDVHPHEFSTLHEEEEIQKLYLMVEAQRFGERLKIICDIPSDLHDCLVPTLMIQPAIENAIKHGVSKTAGKAMVRITVRRRGDRLITTVEDNGPGPPAELNPRGVGVRNILARLDALFGVDAAFTLAPRPEGGAISTIDIPLMRDQARAPSKAAANA